MTFFFDLSNLEKESCNNSKKFMQILDIVYNKRLPSKKKGIPRVLRNIKGTSYILNISPLFTLQDVDINYILQYVKLAARRDYTLYKLYGIKSLQLSYFPDINIQTIKHNPLLKITDTEIHFKYE